MRNHTKTQDNAYVRTCTTLDEIGCILTLANTRRPINACNFRDESSPFSSCPQEGLCKLSHRRTAPSPASLHPPGKSMKTIFITAQSSTTRVLPHAGVFLEVVREESGMVTCGAHRCTRPSRIARRGQKRWRTRYRAFDGLNMSGWTNQRRKQCGRKACGLERNRALYASPRTIQEISDWLLNYAGGEIDLDAVAAVQRVLPVEAAKGRSSTLPCSTGESVAR